MLKFSIVTCTWNSEPLVAEAITSIRDQDYPNVEHIFVDGGSTDGTLERIKALDGDVKVLENVKGGISRAMNAGAAVATGDIIAHMHSDDMYLGTDVFTKVAAAFEEAPDAPWLFGRCKSLIDGKVLDNRYETKRYSQAVLMRRNIIPHMSTFVRRWAFEKAGGFDPRYRCAMDYDLWLKLAKMGDPVQLDDYLAAFRTHAGSLSSVHVGSCHHEDFRVRWKHSRRHPLELAEHLGRYAVRTVRLMMAPRTGMRCC
ncbi:MAG: glycosyltransferase family 2 protein [Hyphomicrobiaceae bacterium]